LYIDNIEEPCLLSGRRLVVVAASIGT
jgi:hypothetical protein